MNQYILEELRRAFLSKKMIAAIILSISLVFGGMWEYLLWIPSGGTSILYIFLAGYNEGTANFLIVAFPLIACLPFTASYVEDCKTGLNKYIYIRMKKRTYRVIRLLVNGLSGGIALASGSVVAFIFLLMAKVFTGMPMVKGQIETWEYLQSVGIHTPFGAMGVILIVLFFCGFIVATIGLGISVFVQNMYLSVLLPFILYIFSATVLLSFSAKLSLGNLYNVNYYGVSFTERLLYGGVLCLISVMLFFAGGHKIEEKNM
ncbi:hypothetical protein P9B03_14140 [Metasolibacillus meyeri]|uniref:ABC transporter permease n=1 Tax=Metasolibacillus meyeri TaxID=1071052 RepID=A0AAW9NX01_9BACL|nr:hypothetical protein [Metasolibacillus meyeri]MEC1179636.1 hypothetical protein [Metasolibacillus meyeri]